MHRQAISASRASGRVGSRWTGVRFPNGYLRAEFVEQLQLWNRIEDLQEIRFRTSPDGVGMTYSCADYRRVGLRLLVDSYGGRIISEPTVVTHFDEEDVASAFACC